LTGSERLLDLCTGTADVALAATRAQPAARRVIGVDFAAAMLRVGAAKVRKAKLRDRVRLVRGDATRIPLGNATVDAVTVAFGIRNVQDMPAACGEIRRVLVANGRLAILEFAVPATRGMSTMYLWYVRRVLPAIGRAISRHNAAYAYLPASIDAFSSPEEFVKILRHTGFSDISAVPLTFGGVILYTARKAP
jgi:demethylmenaquinone methyltransferase/2-methoxy-6-polyprenyl-1,4-benzoquinol methylase